MYKSGVTHYFSIKKASRDLGYKPTVQNALDDVLEEYLTKKGPKKAKKKQSIMMYYFVNLIIAVIFASFVMSFLPGVK